LPDLFPIAALPRGQGDDSKSLRRNGGQDTREGRKHKASVAFLFPLTGEVYPLAWQFAAVELKDRTGNSILMKHFMIIASRTLVALTLLPERTTITA